jgi:hypothetical protein
VAKHGPGFVADAAVDAGVEAASDAAFGDDCESPRERQERAVDEFFDEN